ncbi:MAG: DUF6377 domain-containing protein [Muribaculaceae bacterium]|nr:DUF6377 domain-containing protein [Muribaculaceae bacterium]
MKANKKTISIIQIILLSFAFSIQIKSETYNTDSALNVLDKIISDNRVNEAKKQRTIAHHRFALKNSLNDSLKDIACRNLFYDYRTYKLDSALYFAKKRVALAKNIGIEDTLSSAIMNVADGLKGLGRFYEANKLLDGITKDRYVKSNPYYYHLRHSITLSLYNNSNEYDESIMLNRMLLSYRDSILSSNQPGGIGYIINKAEQFKISGKYKEALNLLIEYKQENNGEVMSNATFLCTLADIYKFLNDEDARKYYLILGTIQDKIKCGKTYTSLQTLALLLNNEGDNERAYRYITCAMEDIISSNARSRLNQVAEFMPIITSAYSKQQAKDSLHRIYYMSSLSILALALLLALLILYKRNGKLNKMRGILDTKNEELVSLNQNLKKLNSKLTDSNKIKEEYIAQLFNLCSGYIDNIESFRLTINRKLKSNQTQDLEKLLKDSVTSSYLKDFFSHFDAIFLDLFPHFIEDFNSLLMPKEQIRPKEGELLTPELRIYALVRLGINDSTKIANFLHYSPQTVYNYRLKIRNKALPSEEKFADLIQLL